MIFFFAQDHGPNKYSLEIFIELDGIYCFAMYDPGIQVLFSISGYIAAIRIWFRKRDWLSAMCGLCYCTTTKRGLSEKEKDKIGVFAK